MINASCQIPRDPSACSLPVAPSRSKPYLGFFRSWKSVLPTFLVGIAIAAILGGCCVWKFGSIKQALAVWSGQKLILDSSSKSFGSVPIGQFAHLSFRFLNNSQEPIRLLGSHTSCSCLMDENQFPIVVEPGESKDFRVKIHTKNPGNYRQQLIVYTSLDEWPSIVLTVTGTPTPLASATLGSDHEQGHDSNHEPTRQN